jgi:hypothetical protein
VLLPDSRATPGIACQASGMDFDQPPVVRVTADVTQLGALPATRWPRTIPAVAQLVAEGLILPKGVTFLVGENGSGKSTIVEAIAAAYGLSPEGGSVQGQHSTRPSESPLGRMLTLRRGLGAVRWGFFLRSETMHGWYTFLEVGDRGLRETAWAELDLVQHWKTYLEDPHRYLRHIL